MEENAQVADKGGAVDGDGAVGGVAETDVGGEVALKIRGPSCIVEDNQFTLLRVGTEAISA